MVAAGRRVQLGWRPTPRPRLPVPDPVVDRLQRALAPAYELVRELGGGGMSRVFVARDTALDREVVVKVVAPEIGAGVSAERFRREVQLAARLQHPNIVPLYSAGSEGVLLWYTMPLVEGETLRDRLRRDGRLRVIDALRLWRELLAALAYAHVQGVVHRDVKPENMLLTTGGRAVVADFGIAKALDAARDVADGDPDVGGTAEAGHDADVPPEASASAASASAAPAAPPGYALTTHGYAIGTPEYMAPEQALADPMVDERADIYAAGLLMYEMLRCLAKDPSGRPSSTAYALGGRPDGSFARQRSTRSPSTGGRLGTSSGDGACATCAARCCAGVRASVNGLRPASISYISSPAA